MQVGVSWEIGSSVRAGPGAADLSELLEIVPTLDDT